MSTMGSQFKFLKTFPFLISAPTRPSGHCHYSCHYLQSDAFRESSVPSNVTGRRCVVPISSGFHAPGSTGIPLKYGSRPLIPKPLGGQAKVPAPTLIISLGIMQQDARGWLAVDSSASCGYWGSVMI